MVLAKQTSSAAASGASGVTEVCERLFMA